MQQNGKESRTTYSEFTSHLLGQGDGPAWARPDEEEGGLHFWRKASKKPVNGTYSRLVRNTAVCLLLALGIWGLKAMESPLAEDIRAATTDVSADEDLGRLHFVDGMEEGQVTAVDGPAYTYNFPLQGEVVASFADTAKDVTIKSEENAQVGAILSGTVVKTTKDTVVVKNDNSTQTTYQGVVPTVAAGDVVKSGAQLGHLAGEALCLETVSGIGYVDSLDADELNTAVVGK
ncbi:MAG: hypothetical protein IJP03_01315 [Christensenellaceae bacterium]|nr:hypothetical protein [Christensenellaceae bacterium]